MLRRAHLDTKKNFSYFSDTEEGMKILVVSQLTNGCLKNCVLKGQLCSELQMSCDWEKMKKLASRLMFREMCVYV